MTTTKNTKWTIALGALALAAFATPNVAMADDNGPVAEHPLPPKGKWVKRDKLEDIHDRREDVRDRAEDRFDRREDVRDHREDIRDAKHDGGKYDEWEDRIDTREDIRDHREDVRDHREDVRDHREDLREKKREHFVRNDGPGRSEFGKFNKNRPHKGRSGFGHRQGKN